MPDQRRHPWAATIRTHSRKPPPHHIGRPQGHNRVVYKQTTAPVDRKHFRRLTCSVDVGGLMTPRVIKLECTNKVCNKSEATCGPCQPSPPIGIGPPACSREHDTPDRVGDN